MLKTLLAATAAMTLISGAGFAETYSNSTTRTTTGVSTPLGDVGVTRTTRGTADRDNTVMERERTERTVNRDFDRDHDRGMRDRAMMDRDHDRPMMNRDHDRDFGMTDKDRTVTKDTHVSANGDVTKKRTETTTVR